MKCLHCGDEIPETIFADWEKSEGSKDGRFNCPHCNADHVRRQVGTLPTGEPLYSCRLWGHLTRMRKKPPPEKK
jgi:DNA-directed RNA polymerase subunit RPC12/RpoP